MIETAGTKKMFSSGIKILLCLAMIFHSCKKEKSDPPVITFELPLSWSSYKVFDTIYVSGKVHDDKEITKLTCTLTGQNNVPVLPVQVIPAYVADKVISIEYIIDNKEIPSGNYRLVIFASDGESDVRAYKDVTIQEMPRALLHYYIAASAVSTSTNIYRSDSMSAPVLLMTVAGDFSGATAVTNNEQFYTAGKFTGNLTAIGEKSGAIAWTLPNCAVSGNPCFTGISSDKALVYVSYFDGKIIGYNSVKNQQFTALTDQNSYPTLTLATENRLLALEKFIQGGANLVIFNNPGGNPLFVIPVLMDVKAMISRNSNEVYIIGNQASSGRIYVCDIHTGIMTLRQQLSGIVISDAAGINEDYIVLAGNSGIVEYDYNSNSLVPLDQASNAAIVKFEDAGSEIYAASSNHLVIYGYQLHTLIQLNSFQLPDSILSIDFIYNRNKFDQD
jgi:hypothetical protein